MTIVEFLTARLDDDEAVALAACAHWEHPDSWECKRGKALEVYGDRVVRAGLASPDPLDVAHVGRGVTHIALHDPVRVLAEVKAKRRIVDAHRAGFPNKDSYAMGRLALCALAAVYADHPDYETRWRP